MSTLTPQQRTLRARQAAFALHAHHDPRATTAAARQAFLDRFSRQVDPDGTLSPADRQRRSDAAKRSYMANLALRSSIARKRRRGGR